MQRAEQSAVQSEANPPLRLSLSLSDEASEMGRFLAVAARLLLSFWPAGFCPPQVVVLEIDAHAERDTQMHTSGAA